MSAALSLQSLLNEVRLETPGLSRELLNAIQAELDANTKHFPLLEGWRRMRGRFAADFERAMLPLLETAGLGQEPLERRAPANLDALSLVDERQALQDVAIAHVIQAIEDGSGPELHQLSNFFAALRGTARARKNENPLRAALFAQALLVALSSVEMEPQHRYDLMRVAATPMAPALHRIYSTLCARLRAAELSQMVSSHAARAQDHDIAQRIAQGRRNTEPATLDGLARRVQEHNTRPTTLQTPTVGAPTPIFIAGPGPDLLSRLYEQILADPRLLPAMKALLARLQVAVVRLARHDSNLLHRQDHPTWALLNRVAAHGMAFERADDERLLAFLRFMTAETQSLIEAPIPVAAQFQQVLKRVESHLSSQAQQRSERSALALASLEREQKRTQWLRLLREQITAQIADAPLGPELRQFLQTDWVEVIVQAMVLHGQTSQQALAGIEWVDHLLASLHKPDGERGQQQLRMALPDLIAQLRSGCDAIALSEDKREPVLQELMLQHGRILRGLPALSETAARHVATHAATSSTAEPSPEELLQHLLTERESQLPEHWAHTKVDRAQLPTVAMQLFDQHDHDASMAAVSNWIAGQRVGSWYHLFIQSEWLTAQIAWISDSEQFYLFIGQDADQRHTLTRGAVERLLANGLITALDDDSLVQHAVDSLMQDLQSEA
ncbi:DUF1631 domain-containing protein [Roseateles oligotrophus]|uniref:DUF1631 domain-containing protein n=1 Tax=Roseateles oligotrophus TaxID=1769250 RepID=A0ABT2YEC3_9BURK|nr:DUF1631 domain-containing protein [Roseateles oligotrophus]MCV2368400.1 DUF1631 domain-containing protein [Roseateles oligotrophus]